MRNIDLSFEACDDAMICIGKQGENRAVCVRIDCRETLFEHEGASALIKVENANGVVYPGQAELTDGVLEWTITKSDTAYAGLGKAQIELTGPNGEVIKTAIIQTGVLESLQGAGETPDPVQDWLEEAVEKLKALTESVEAAFAAASAADAAASDAILAAGDADDATDAANQAAATANAAAQRVEDAIDGAADAADAANAAAALVDAAIEASEQATQGAQASAAAATQAAQEAEAKAALADAAAQGAEASAGEADAAAGRANAAAESIEGLTISESVVEYGAGVEASVTRDPESGALHMAIQTERGPQGPGYTIKGEAYATVEALEAAVTSPAVGDQYNVGAAAPYNVYRWTGAGWEDQGKIQGPAGLDAPQINDDEALPTNPWSGLKTQEEIAKVEGKIYPCTAQALEAMSQEQQAELYVQGYRAIKTENNETVVTLGLAADGSLAWQGCNQDRTNLLDNPDFSDPINQRGLTTYSGSFIYAIDRWVISGTISLQSGGISVSPSGFFLQRMEQLINGEDYTLAVYVGNQLLVGTVTYDSASSDAQVAVSNSLGTLFIQNIEGNLCQFVVNPVTQSIISMPVLLKGAYTGKTLPPWEESDYVTECLKCLWYYRALASYGRTVFKPYGEIANTIVSSDKMRILPTAVTVDLQVFDGTAIWVPATVASVTWMGDGYKVRFNVDGTISNGNVYIMQGLTGLSADL